MRTASNLVLIAGLLGCLAGCSHIEDTNGSDTALATLTLEKVAGRSLSLVSSGVTVKATRRHTTVVGEREAEDVDRYEMSEGRTSGVDTLMATQLHKGERLEPGRALRVGVRPILGG